MTAKQYLQQGYYLNKQIDVKCEQIRKLREMTQKVTATANDCKVQASGSQSRMADTVDKMVDLERELADAVNEYAAKRQEIAAVIQRVDNPNYRTLLEYRYLACMKWEEIAVRMHYSWQWVHKMHKRALKEAQEAIESDYKRVV